MSIPSSFPKFLHRSQVQSRAVFQSFCIEAKSNPGSFPSFCTKSFCFKFCVLKFRHTKTCEERRGSVASPRSSQHVPGASSLSQSVFPRKTGHSPVFGAFSRHFPAFPSTELTSVVRKDPKVSFCRVPPVLCTVFPQCCSSCVPPVLCAVLRILVLLFFWFRSSSVS